MKKSERNDFKTIEGPWSGEPDELRFEHANHACHLRRGPFGAWCGYVEVKPGSPLFGKDYSEELEALKAQFELCKGQPLGETPSMAVMLPLIFGTTPTCSMDVVFAIHGGVTFAASIENEDWWIGFDCGHAGDLAPGMFVNGYGGVFGAFTGEVYRTIQYAREQTQSLAEQIDAVERLDTQRKETK